MTVTRERSLLLAQTRFDGAASGRGLESRGQSEAAAAVSHQCHESTYKQGQQEIFYQRLSLQHSVCANNRSTQHSTCIAYGHCCMARHHNHKENQMQLIRQNPV